MQHEGSPRFIHAHSGVVKGVAFSPRDRYVFCSGGTDGKVNVYNALQGQHTMSTKITSPNTMKNINAVKFNADGSRILATTAKRLSVIDAERGELVCSYDNCAYSSRDRAPLASDPYNPYMAVCSCVNGKGVITIDLRQPSPSHYALSIHSSIIKDLIYLHRSWPYGENHQDTVVTISLDGICKILRTTDDHVLDVFDVKHRSNCLTATPNEYSMFAQEGFESLIMVGGDSLTEYSPPPARGMQARLTTLGPNDRPINKLKYTSNGHLLYAISGDGQVRRYRRIGREHQLLGNVYMHNDEVLDMDISPNDEYIVTASRDGNVGLLCLGAPSHGWTGFMEMA